MRRIFLVLSFVALISACRENTGSTEVTSFALSDFQALELKIEDEKPLVIDDLFLARPSSIVYHEDGYLMIGDNRNTKILSVIDLKNNTYSQYVTRGRAQNEVMALWDLVPYDGGIYISSPMDRKVLRLAQNEDRRIFEYDTTYVFVNQFMRCLPSGSGFVSLASASSGDRFNVWNPDAEIVDTTGSFPTCGIEADGLIHNGVLQSDMIISPDGRNIVTAYKNVDYIDIYQDFSLKRRLRGPENFDIRILTRDIGDGMMRTTTTPSVFTYHQIVPVKDGFYVGYIGFVQDDDEIPSYNDTRIKKIMHFSWKGVPLKLYTLESPVDAFTVDHKGENIYCLKSVDEPEIVRYSL